MYVRSMGSAGLAELTECPPGRSLAAGLASVDLASPSGDELVTVLQAKYRQRCHQEARYVAVLVETGRTQAGLVRAVEVNQWASSEIGAALTLTHASATRELEFAQTVVLHLPSVHAAMLAGALDRGKAWVFADLLADVTAEQRAVLCDMTVARAQAWTAGQLRARLQRLIIEIDPDWALRRHRQAVAERRVVAYLAGDGTVTLAGSGLPACEAACA